MPIPILVSLATLASFEGYPALAASNGRLHVVMLTEGASIVSVVLEDDAEKLNPLWNPFGMARENGRPVKRDFKTPGFGHFVCVDGFGPVSPEEQKAGLPGHGEAHRQHYQILRQAKDGNTLTLTLGATLPIVQEKFTRTLQLVDGENVIYVESELESLLGFDRPVNWAEHATIGAPFLEREKTVSDMPAARAITRPDPENGPGHRLIPGRDFEWPFAPGVDGTPVDVRSAGPMPSADHTTCFMDESRRLAFVTFLHPEKRLLLGYLFRREEFPWVQNWEEYPASGELARGLEFSTQPYDVPRREAPVYRWLPAKSKIGSRFLMFWTRTPEGFSRIEDVRLENGSVVIRDASGKTMSLAASLGL